MNGFLFIDKNGDIKQVSLEDMLSDCPSRRFFEYVECLKNQLKEKREELRKQAIEEIRKEEEDKLALEESEDIGELLSMADKFAETLIEKYMEIKERRGNENEIIGIDTENRNEEIFNNFLNSIDGIVREGIIDEEKVYELIKRLIISFLEISEGNYK